MRCAAVVPTTIALAIAACSGSKPDPGGGDGADDDTAGVYELAGIDPTLPTDDLMPLATLVGDAEVVAVGESFHTSGGFHQLAARVARFLIEEMGFRAITLETPWGPALAVTAYLASCAAGTPVGTARDGLASLMFVWRSAEIEQFLTWACEFNQEHPDDPIVFFGFEMWQPWFDLIAITTLLDQAAPAAKPGLIGGLVTCNGIANPVQTADEYYLTQFLVPSTPQDHQTCLAGLAQLDDFFARNEATLVAATSQQVVDWVGLSIASLRRNQEAFYDSSKTLPEVLEARDLGSFHTMSRLRELAFPDSRQIVWAHNGHIAMRHEDIGPEDNGFAGAKDLGSFLHADLGDSYAAIASVARRVGVRTDVLLYPAPDPSGVVEARKADTVELVLHGLKAPHLLVDTTAPVFAPDVELLLGGMRLVPAEQYRAILYTEETEPMRDPE